MYKIFIGLSEIIGYNSNLKKGFQKLGVDCTFINLSYHPFQYGGDDEPNFFVKMCKWNYKQMNKQNYKILKAPFFASAFILKVTIFIWALYRYDVFLFSFGASFFHQHLDLPILKLFNKKIIFTLFGSDGRPPYIDNSRHDLTLVDYIKLSQKIKSNIVSIERHANHVVTHSAYAQFHHKKFINLLSIGIPFSAQSLNDSAQTKTKAKNGIIILHSPSDPIGKGSNHIRVSITELKQKGYKINYVEITGKPHDEVIKALQDCDFVVDQVYSDTPMAGFATEAAWFGKSAVVGGYYAEYIKNELALKDIPPSMFCHPDEITSAIERLIVDEEYRLELGKRAQCFVRTKKTPEQVARYYLQMIEGTIPEEYMFDPNTIRYVQGYGMPESQSKEIIRNMIEQYGIESLYLSDKPELEQRFREYAYDIREEKNKNPVKSEEKTT